MISTKPSRRQTQHFLTSFRADGQPANMSDAEMQEEELEVKREAKICCCWCFSYRCSSQSMRGTRCTAVRTPPATATSWESMGRANPSSWRSSGVPPILQRFPKSSYLGEQKSATGQSMNVRRIQTPETLSGFQNLQQTRSWSGTYSILVSELYILKVFIVFNLVFSSFYNNHLTADVKQCITKAVEGKGWTGLPLCEIDI